MSPASFRLTLCRGRSVSVRGGRRELQTLVLHTCATRDAANAALPAYVLTLQFFVGLLIRISDIPGECEYQLAMCLMIHGLAQSVKLLVALQTTGDGMQSSISSAILGER